MATRYFLARNPRVAQIQTITVGTYDSGTTYRVTVGGAVVSVVGTGGTNATTAAALQAALSASLAGEMLEIAFTNTSGSAVITCTARTPGTPFTLTVAASGGTGTISTSVTTANSSPSDWGSATNWDTFPVSGDDIVVEGIGTPILWNLNALASIDIVTAWFRASATGQMCLKETNTIGGTSYAEYRPKEISFQTCTNLYSTEPANPQPEMRKFATGSNACTALFIGSGTGQVGQEVTWWRGTHSTNVVRSEGASVAIAPISSTSATVATLVGVANAAIRCGSGVGTITSASIRSSQLDVQSAVTTLTLLDGATVICRFSMTVGTLNLYNGRVIYSSNGTITTLALGSESGTGSIDFSLDSRTMTITNLVNATRGSSFNDPGGRVTLSAGITLSNGRLSDMTFVCGVNKTYTLS